MVVVAVTAVVVSAWVWVAILVPIILSPISTLRRGIWGYPHSLFELSNISALLISMVIACAICRWSAPLKLLSITIEKCGVLSSGRL